MFIGFDHQKAGPAGGLSVRTVSERLQRCETRLKNFAEAAKIREMSEKCCSVIQTFIYPQTVLRGHPCCERLIAGVFRALKARSKYGCLTQDIGRLGIQASQM
jgi:hypothetical protein